jgi:regulatory protein
VAAVAPADRRGRRVEVTLASGTVYLIDANVAGDLGIGPGVELDLAAAQAMLDADDLVAAKQVATRQLAFRPRSTSELRQTLHQRGFSDHVVDQVIERFLALGYLDDADFARRWIQTREQISPRGTRLLKQELRQKGIEPEMAEEAIAEAAVDDVDAAMRLAERRVSKMAGLDRDTQRRRLAGFLERRGFSYEVIRTVDRAFFETR